MAHGPNFQIQTQTFEYQFCPMHIKQAIIENYSNTHTHIDLVTSRKIWAWIFFTQIKRYDIQIQDSLCWSWSI